MKIPKTSAAEPYIEFKINKKGEIKLCASPHFWGGKNGGFGCSDGSEGNSCKPNDLEVYIKAFKNRKIKTIEKEIVSLQNKLEKIKSRCENSLIFLNKHITHSK